MSGWKWFITSLLVTAIRYIPLFLISLAVSIVGALWVPKCTAIGLGVLGLYVLIVLVSSLKMQITLFKPDGDPEFNAMMDQLRDDPQGFIGDIIEAQEANVQLHGEELLRLDDLALFEAVYAQNLRMTEDAEDEASSIGRFSGPRRVVYILSLFDGEIQNGGLCQFFVNSSREAAPYVADCLNEVGAYDHADLLENFVSENGIDLDDLTSFKVFSRLGYARQTKRYDFDSFDESYYELPPLQEFIVKYIRDNVGEF